MPIDQSLAGRTFPPTQPYDVTEQAVADFAAATGTPYATGDPAPATFPIVVPFLVLDNVARAMQASRAVTVAMLFVAGFALGRYAGHARPALTGASMALLGIALIAAIIALGG